MNRNVVFSGVNFFEGGPLSIFKDATANFLALYSKEFHLILLVHKKSLFKEFDLHERLTIKEYPWTRKNYFFRLYFEWVKCRFISRQFKPLLWFALHDITPNVRADIRAVYCHNPSPFYRLTLQHAFMDKTFFLHNLLYKFFYGINLQKNDYVVVQQAWIKKEFEKKYNVKNVLVAHPDVQVPTLFSNEEALVSNQLFTFVYPAFPRVFKNFEVVFEAANILSVSNISFQLVVTIDGSENKYSKYLVEKYGHIKQIQFIGLQKRETALGLIKECDCLLFPSKLETWGLPLTEARFFKKNILAAQLEYAYETLQGYEQACYFPPDDYTLLSEMMHKAILGKLIFCKRNDSELADSVGLNGWKALFHLMLGRIQKS